MEHQGHGAGQKKGLVEKIKETLPGGRGDHQQTGGNYGHTGTATHGAPATGGTYGQQGHTGTATHGAPATGGHTGVTGTGTHGTGEKGVVENIKEKLPGGHGGDHQQTGGTYGQQGHTGTVTHGTPATGGTYGQQGHTETTGLGGTHGTGEKKTGLGGTHGTDEKKTGLGGTHGTGEKKGIMDKIKDKLPGQH